MDEMIDGRVSGHAGRGGLWAGAGMGGAGQLQLVGGQNV